MTEFELPPHRFTAAMPFLPQFNQTVLPRAVLEGVNPGWVFVDQLPQPRRVLVGLPCGYFFLAGEMPGEAELAGLRRIIREVFVPRSRAAGNNGFLISFPNLDWQVHLAALLGPDCPTVPIFRRTFRFDPFRFAQQTAELPPLAEGFALQRIDAALLLRFPNLAGEVMAGWGTVADFLAHGRGVVICAGEEVACFCLSPFACNDALEISVLTAAAYRRKGLARQAAAAFIRLCLAAGLRPNWECFWDNQPSTALARALGFEVEQDYPIFYWEDRPLQKTALPLPAP